MTRPNGRLLALDLGSARVGVAVSDPLGLTASPSGWFPRRGPVKDVAAVRDLVVEHEAVGVVVGHPLRLTGEAGDTARESEAFAERLRAGGIDVPVILWDERVTTVQAERAMIEGGSDARSVAGRSTPSRRRSFSRVTWTPPARRRRRSFPRAGSRGS